MNRKPAIATSASGRSRLIIMKSQTMGISNATAPRWSEMKDTFLAHERYPQCLYFIFFVHISLIMALLFRAKHLLVNAIPTRPDLGAGDQRMQYVGTFVPGLNQCRSSHYRVHNNPAIHSHSPNIGNQSPA
jgi:hypothetical protein